MFKHTLLAMAACLWLLPAAASDLPLAPASVPGTMLVSAEQVVDVIGSQPTLLLIDSRRREEFEKGHIEGALNLLDTELTHAVLAKLAPSADHPLLFYCNGERCLRSPKSAAQAVSWGYRKVYWFRGGWQDWAAKKLPIAR